jgi:hypothetical protein
MSASGAGVTAAQRDRAVGVLLGTAAADALGAGHEFGGPMAADEPGDRHEWPRLNNDRKP